MENPELYQKVVQIYTDNNLTQSTDPLVYTKEFKEFYDKYENTVDPRLLYPKIMVKSIPTGLLGLLIAVFLAAYMSTIASQINWGTS